MARRRRRFSRRDPSSPRSTRLALVSAVVLLAGLFDLMVGMAQLLQPEWYFANLADYPPYNRVFVGQIGAALLPLGIAMVISSQNPTDNRMLIGAGAGAAILIALSQWAGVINGEIPAEGSISAVLPWTVAALAQAWAFWQIRLRLRRRAG